MATTTNYGWTTPDDTALVKDGAAAIRTLGSSVDTTTKNLNPETTLGDIAYRSSSSNTNTRLAIGSSGQVLTVAAGVPSWATPTDQTPLTTKGDLFTFSTVDARLGVGANGTTLVADSGEATGLKYVAGLSIAFNAQTAAYTLVAGDAFKLVTVSDTVSRTVTIPPSVFTAGQIINVQRIGTGAVPFAAGSGVTITSTGATSAAPTLRAQFSAASIVCTASNTFTVLGDIA